MIIRLKLYFSILTAALIIIINYYATKFDVYWILKWFDIPMHILGGMMVGFFGLTAFDYFTSRFGTSSHFRFFLTAINEKNTGNKRRALWVMSFVLLVGVVWEIVEMFFGLGGLSEQYRLNTIKDIFDDLFGGALSILIWRFLFVKINKNDKYKTGKTDR